jgi:F-type H+-transporting ATPase subunit b
VVTHRDRRLAALAISLVALGARDALAAEGGLELFPEPPVLALLVALFAGLVPVVNLLLLRPMLRVLDLRDERTGGARRRAGRLEEQVRELVARYERSLQEARQTAERARREMLEDASRRAAQETGAARAACESELARVRLELAAALAEARRGLRSQAEELAREAAARVLGRGLE